jgi:hypothetical protein
MQSRTDPRGVATPSSSSAALVFASLTVECGGRLDRLDVMALLPCCSPLRPLRDRLARRGRPVLRLVQWICIRGLASRRCLRPLALKLCALRGRQHTGPTRLVRGTCAVHRRSDLWLLGAQGLRLLVGHRCTSPSHGVRSMRRRCLRPPVSCPPCAVRASTGRRDWRCPVKSAGCERPGDPSGPA